MLRESVLGPTPKALDWQCLSVKKGETVTGVLAGRIRNFRCHNVRGQSKPCVTFATDGALKCWCSSRPSSVRTIGYAPIFTQAGERLVVILSAIAAWKIRDAVPGQLLSFTRPDRAKQPITPRIVGGAAALAQWVRQLKDKCDCDILEYLCHLWQIHALTVHCGFAVRRSLAAASVVEVNDWPHALRFPRIAQPNQLMPPFPVDGEGV